MGEGKKVRGNSFLLVKKMLETFYKIDILNSEIRYSYKLLE